MLRYWFYASDWNAGILPLPRVAAPIQGGRERRPYGGLTGTKITTTLFRLFLLASVICIKRSTIWKQEPLKWLTVWRS